MGVIDLFSKRQKRQRGEVPDVFTYDAIPQEFRVQVTHIWLDALGRLNPDPYVRDKAEAVYKSIHDRLAREYGKFQLANGDESQERKMKFFLNETHVDRVLDVIELSFQYVRAFGSNYEH